MKSNNILLFIAYLMLSTAGVILIKSGLTNFVNKSSVTTLCESITKALTNQYLISGAILYTLSFAVWIVILSGAKLTAIYPAMIGLNILLIALSSVIFLKESIGLIQGFGIGLLIVAICMILHGK